MSFDRVNSTFENISDSMTNFFRENGFTNFSNPAEGTVLRDQTFLSVRWGWLAFPTTLVILTSIFFIGIIVDTRPTGGRAEIWKSSPLALLFHGLEMPDRHQTNVNDINGMKGLTKGMIVKLSTTEKGLKFKEIKDKRNARTGALK